MFKSEGTGKEIISPLNYMNVGFNPELKVLLNI